MSSYSSLLSLSPVDHIGGYVDDGGGGGGDDDMAVAASYLAAFDIDVGEEYYPPEEAADYAFHSEQQAPATAPFLASPQADSDSYKSGKAASSGGGGESSKLQSQWGGTAELSSQGLFSHDKIVDMVLTTGGGCGGARGLARSRSSKIAFKTRSEVEVLDDGYRWRKYGKKMVKNSPNPRNYYRCSSEECRVKKRVERERDDAHFVITTYDGVHNHPAPLPPRGCAGYSLGQLSPWKAADTST